jgi:hypothetical protein
MARVKKKDHFGFIDKKGKPLIPLDYDDASDFKDGRCFVTKEGKMGIIDANNTFILSCEYDKIKPLEGSSTCLVLEKAGKIAYFNLSESKIFWKEEGF